jgi:iron only hydrogenase large subunit-like protein
VVESDDFNKIFSYKHRVLLIPCLFTGQFPQTISEDDIYHALYQIGFTQIVEVETSVDFLAESIDQYIENNPKPTISSFCPAIVRLIQVNYPSLIDNLMHLKAPVDITAEYCKKQLLQKGVDENDIGIFYITPCAAKIAAVRAPVGEYGTVITSVLNMDDLYNKTYHQIKQNKASDIQCKHTSELSDKSIRWTLTNGEAGNIKGRCLAIDGMDNVIEFLDKLEDEDTCNFDFLEIRACDESCPGGILALGNRFLAVEHMKHMAEKAPAVSQLPSEFSFTYDMIKAGNIEERSMVKYDKDIGKAIEKMERAKKLRRQLPNIDCGACGAPSCEALSDDVVRGESKISYCIFIQKQQEQSGDLSNEQSFEIMEEIWGKHKFRRK